MHCNQDSQPCADFMWDSVNILGLLTECSARWKSDSHTLSAHCVYKSLRTYAGGESEKAGAFSDFLKLARTSHLMSAQRGFLSEAGSHKPFNERLAWIFIRSWLAQAI